MTVLIIPIQQGGYTVKQIVGCSSDPDKTTWLELIVQDIITNLGYQQRFLSIKSRDDLVIENSLKPDKNRIIKLSLSLN